MITATNAAGLTPLPRAVIRARWDADGGLEEAHVRPRRDVALHLVRDDQDSQAWHCYRYEPDGIHLGAEPRWRVVRQRRVGEVEVRILLGLYRQGIG